MLSNKILNVLLDVTAFLFLPVQFLTTFILGILVSVSFGLLLLPISVLWMLISFPMIAVSWLTSRIEWLRTPLGLMGIPWAIAANVFVSLMPSMGELESRAAKLMFTETWPYSWEFWRFQTGKTNLFASLDNICLIEIFERISKRDPLRKSTIHRIVSGEPLDPKA